MTRTLAIMLAGAWLAAAPGKAAAKADPDAFPELSLEQLLPPLMVGLKRYVPDAYSIRDLTVCPAKSIKLRAGRPVGWIVRLAFNSRNENGGYTGLSAYGAFFKDGKVTRVLATTSPTSDPLLQLLNRRNIDSFADCPSVPDGRVQQLLQNAKAF